MKHIYIIKDYYYTYMWLTVVKQNLEKAGKSNMKYTENMRLLRNNKPPKFAYITSYKQ